MGSFICGFFFNKYIVSPLDPRVSHPRLQLTMARKLFSMHSWESLDVESWLCAPSGVHPAALGPHTAQDGRECGPTWDCKLAYNIMRFFVWLCVTMYLMCGPKQLFFFQCGPELPKGWTPIIPFYVRDLRICRFGYPWGFWDRFPLDNKEWLSFRGVNTHTQTFGWMGGGTPKPWVVQGSPVYDICINHCSPGSRLWLEEGSGSSLTFWSWDHYRFPRMPHKAFLSTICTSSISALYLRRYQGGRNSCIPAETLHSLKKQIRSILQSVVAKPGF